MIWPHAIVIAFLHFENGRRRGPDSLLWTDKKYTILTCSHCHGITHATGQLFWVLIPWLPVGGSTVNEIHIPFFIYVKTKGSGMSHIFV